MNCAEETILVGCENLYETNARSTFYNILVFIIYDYKTNNSMVRYYMFLFTFH